MTNTNNTADANDVQDRMPVRILLVNNSHIDDETEINVNRSHIIKFTAIMRAI